MIITSEEAISKGIRRIVAVTGAEAEKADKLAAKYQAQLNELGEEVKAVVSLRPDRINGSNVRFMDVCDDRTAIVESVQAFCKEKLAAYKWPRIVEIIESLPKGSTGKISKKLLRSKAIAGSTSSKL